MRRAVRVTACAILAAVLLGACGNDDNGVSSEARERLTPIIDQVRKRAAAHDAVGAERALANLRQNVNRFEQKGEIGGNEAAAILQAARSVENRLTLITTTTTTTTTLPPPPPEPPDHDKGKGHGKGRKHGHDKDDEGD